ncbi:MAG: thioredoxin [Candidatus Cloacimonetes bacterium]|jgi:thioredoxin|nr:thioredoxin [Candidatus Cloacimonadota bacterium]MBT5420670.1 thioredoxin [Candidatus Cloacimonadota bacterium]
MRKLILILLAITLMIPLITEEVKAKPEYIALETFKEKIFDFENDTEWNYKGELPAIIDFYADWCGPCKRVAPIMEELAAEYDGKVKIYKIDTEDQKELASIFGIRSIPSILFIPVSEQPQMSTGALPKAEFEKMIKEILKVD